MYSCRPIEDVASLMFRFLYSWPSWSSGWWRPRPGPRRPRKRYVSPICLLRLLHVSYIHTVSPTCLISSLQGSSYMSYECLSGRLCIFIRVDIFFFIHNRFMCDVSHTCLVHVLMSHTFHTCLIYFCSDSDVSLCIPYISDLCLI